MGSIDFSGTFDSMNALSGMYLWLIFGFLAGLLNCDLQRFMSQHPSIVHLFGLTAFFFLFTLLDTNNKNHIVLVWVKTIFIYILFVLMTKSKWYFAIPVITILLIDQTLKKHVAIKQANGKATDDDVLIQQDVSKFLNVFVICVIIIGAIHYIFVQMAEYGDKFSFATFLFGITKCKGVESTFNTLKRSNAVAS